MDKILTMQEVYIETLKGVNLNFIAYKIANSNEKYFPVVENCLRIDLQVNEVIEFLKEDDVFKDNLVLVAVNKKGNLTFNLCVSVDFLPYFLFCLPHEIYEKSSNKKIFIDFIKKANHELIELGKQFFNITITSSKNKK